MANFLLVYTGGDTASSEAERGKMLEAWGAWFGKLGDQIVDAGNPFVPHAKHVSHDGTVHEGAIGTAATGYSIVRADSLSAAADLAKACPVLTSGGGITVYEIHPAM